MPRAYFPREVIFVKASPPHPEGTEYVVSIGDEKWDGKTFVHVAKIQMAYEGRIEGRKAPSFPVGTDDFERVAEAIRQLDVVPRGNPKSLPDRPDENGAFVRGAAYYAEK